MGVILLLDWTFRTSSNSARTSNENRRPYELRHTAISHQADRGRSSWEIADWAGTSERMISDVYRHQLTQVSALTPCD